MAISADNVLLLRVVRDHIQSWPDKPMTLHVEDHGTTVPALVIQQLAETEVKRRYINGSYIGAYHFAVYAVINAEDTASRFNAIDILNQLAGWLTEKDRMANYQNLPTLGSCRTATAITQNSTPVLTGRLPDGTEEYQALFTLDYKFSTGGKANV